MKSLLKYFLIAIIATSLIPLSSCKKGANDPFLSLRSRTSRLAGTWKLSKFEKTKTQKVTIAGFLTTTVDNWVYDGTKMTYTNTVTIGTTTPNVTKNTYLYSETWTIEKANTYVLAKTSNNGGTSASTTVTINGNWAWLNKDKDAGLKNKEAFVAMDEITKGNGTSSSGKTDEPRVMILDELKNTEMIILINEKSDSGNGVVVTTTGTETYNQ